MTEILVHVARGIPVTLAIAAASWLLMAGLGGVIAAGYHSRLSLVRGIADFASMFLRGVPEIVALFVVFFGLRQVFEFTPFEAAVLAFGFVGSPFAAEVYRGALRTVGPKQWEAGKSLGMGQASIFLFIILPQAVRFAVPPMLNLLIGMLNVTAVAAAIGVPAVIQKADIVLRSGTVGNTFFYATASVCIIYFCIVFPLQRFSQFIERKLAKSSGIAQDGKSSLVDRLSLARQL